MNIVISLSVLCSVSVASEYRDYCVIGAGPSGLQIGYFLEKAGRDYVIFEKEKRAGSFFEKYPRHRQLISINKKYTGRTNGQFNLRHDWNSLLSEDNSLLFTNYTDDYFPNADVMINYLNDYQRIFGIKVQFETEITNLKHNGADQKCRFSMLANKKTPFCCRDAIIAIGISKPNKPGIRGEEFVETYDDVNIDPKSFKDQSVLIIGRGNSGMELASRDFP